MPSRCWRLSALSCSSSFRGCQASSASRKATHSPLAFRSPVFRAGQAGVFLMDHNDSIPPRREPCLRVVGRSVIDNDHLRRADRLIQRRLHRINNKVCAVERRDDDADRRLRHMHLKAHDPQEDVGRNYKQQTRCCEFQHHRCVESNDRPSRIQIEIRRRKSQNQVGRHGISARQ